MQDKTIWRRIALIAVLLLGGFVFPLLLIIAAWTAWTVYQDLRNPPQPDPNADAWYVRRWTATAEDSEWKSYYLPFCESPAETAFLEAMIAAYGLLPEKGVLKGAGLTLNLQVEINPYRADFLANDWLVIEIDGATYHSSPEAVARDRTRDQYLQEGGYSVLRIPAKVIFDTPEEAVRKVRSAIAAGRKPQRSNAHESLTVSTLVNRVVQGSQQAVKALDDLHDHVNLQVEVQKATEDLRLALYSERIWIEGARDTARRSIERQKRLEKAGPQMRELYEQTSRELASVVDDLRKEHPTPASPPPPVFKFPPKHANSKIADAIENKISSLKNERDLFLCGISKEICADHKLRQKFEENLRELGAYEIYTRVFPVRI